MITPARIRGTIARLRARHYDRPTREDDRMLCLAVQQGVESEAAISAILEAHKGLCVTIVNNYAVHHQWDDAMSEARIGLAIAAQRFDVDRGIRFSTYAGHWVSSRVRRVCIDTIDAIRIPEYMAYRVHKVRKAIRRGVKDPEQIAFATGLELADVMESIRIMRITTFSLDDPVVEGGIKADEYLFDPEEDPQKIVVDGMQDPAVRAAVNRLQPTARAYVTLLFGLDGAEPRTYEEVARIRGVSKQSVHSSVEMALGRLAKELAHAER